jgi:hypothetical protein
MLSSRKCMHGFAGSSWSRTAVEDVIVVDEEWRREVRVRPFPSSTQHWEVQIRKMEAGFFLNGASEVEVAHELSGGPRPQTLALSSAAPSSLLPPLASVGGRSR